MIDTNHGAAFTRLFTGPAWVGQYAERIERAGCPVVTKGTEHVYVWLPMDTARQWGILPALAALERRAGFAFGTLDARVLYTREEAPRP